ncbi:MULTISPECIES: hypothetical protein [Mesorhizobium]|uniref:hypothetical protein n=1 Tax=Mesorhizobium TaxID=68287 RepID=UPI0010A951AB|nr:MULTISPECIES: hypothetical protein [Mesorhizobium]
MTISKEVAPVAVKALDIDRASESIAEMVADWYGNAPLPNARITASVIAQRLARFITIPATADLAAIPAPQSSVLRPADEWSEEDGPVLWWRFPIAEAPYVGSPLDCGQTVEVELRAHGVEKLMRANVGGWPGYHTHWQAIAEPLTPSTQDPHRPEVSP